MKKNMILLAFLVVLTMAACDKGYLGMGGHLLSPARSLTGKWKGSNIKVTKSEDGPGTAVCVYLTLSYEIDFTQKGNDVTGVLNATVTSYTNGTCNFPPVTLINSALIGTVSGVNLTLRDDLSWFLDGKGPTRYDFTFTTDNMEGTATEVVPLKSGLTSATNAIKLYKE